MIKKSFPAKRILFLLSAFILLYGPVYASSLQERLDSLRTVVGPGDTKKNIGLLKSLIHDAHAAGQTNIELTAQTLLGHLENYRGNLAEGKRLLNDALAHEHSLMEGEDPACDLRALIYSGLAQNVIISDGNYYLGKEYYLRAVREALKIDNKALYHYIMINLMRAGLLNDDMDLEKEASETLAWAKANDDAFVQFHTLSYLAQVELYNHNTANAERYQQEALKIGSDNHLKNRGSWYMTQSSLLEQKGDLPGALAQLDAALRYLESENEPNHFNALLKSRKVSILMKLNQYKEAKRIASEAYEFSIKSGQKSTLNIILKQLSDIADHNGEKDEALNWIRQRESFQDSTMDHDKEVLIQNLSMLYNLDKKEIQIRNYHDLLSKEKERNLFLWIAIGLLILLCGSGLCVFAFRERHHKQLVALAKASADRDRQLMGVPPILDAPPASQTVRRNALLKPDTVDDEEENEKETEEAEEPLTVDINPTDHSAPKNTTHLNLFFQLTEQINGMSDWSDKSLGRETMSKILKTNRTYLAQAVKFHTGMTYSQFINHIRINKAIEILSDKRKNDYPLKAVCLDLGFGSLNAFYSNFKAATGISPAAFRKNN